MAGHPILVTGAAGFAGCHLLARFRSTDSERPLHAWSRRVRPDADRVQWHQVEVTDRDAVRHAIVRTRPSHIVHLAGSPHVGQSWHSSLAPLKTNVLGTHYLLEAVRTHVPQCRVLVVTSAMIYRAGDALLDEEAPLEPASPYGLSKLAQDQLALSAARDDGLDVLVARPFNHTGPSQSPEYAVSAFARQIALIEAGLLPAEMRVGNLDAMRDMTDVRDVVDAYARLLTGGRSGCAYNICSGTTYRIGDLLDMLIGMAPLPITRTVDAEQLRPSDLPRLAGDCSRLRNELGWTPRHPITTTLAETLHWWRMEVASGRVTA